MAMTDAKWAQANGLTSDPGLADYDIDATDTPHLPRFVTGEYVYRFSDYTLSINLQRKPYLIQRESRVTDTDAYLDATGVESNPTTYNKATRADESEVCYFYDIRSHRTSKISHHVHQSDLATLAEIQSYVGTQAALWVNPT